MEKKDISKIFVASDTLRIQFSETVNRFISDGWKIGSEFYVTPNSMGGVVFSVVLIK
jgi:hypothetical protein